MSILPAMQSAALRLVGQRPSAFFGSSDKFAQEVSDLVNEVAVDVCQSFDWQKLIKIASISGDGSRSEFPAPFDYSRMLVISRIQDSEHYFWDYEHVTDINRFLALQDKRVSSTPGFWTLYGGIFHFTPAPTGNASFPYISKDYAYTDDGVVKSAFDSDSDNFVLPERLLTLGLVWRWRENKKLDFTGDQEAFVKAMDEYSTKDRGSRTYRRNGGPTYPGTYPAWPWPLG